MYLTDYKEALRIQEKVLQEAIWHAEDVSTWNVLLEILEPERRFKRITKTNIDRINAKIREKGGNICSCRIEKARYGLDRIEFCFYYITRKLRFKEVTERYEYEYIETPSLSGEDVYRCVKERIETRKLWADYSQMPSVKELEAFYDDLEGLKQKHKCFERGLELLCDRNLR